MRARLASLLAGVATLGVLAGCGGPSAPADADRSLISAPDIQWDVPLPASN